MENSKSKSKSSNGFKIAILGKMCSGKTTLCNKIDNYVDGTVARLSFAKKVKDLATELFGMSTDPQKKNRKLTVDIGTKMREIDPNVWANYTAEESDSYEYVLIDDLRYNNEYERLRERGFIIIKLVIDEELQLKRLKETYPDTWQIHRKYAGHSSENDLWTRPDSDFDLVLQSSNNDTNFEIVRKYINS